MRKQKKPSFGVGFAVHTGSVRQDRRREELKRFKTDPDCRVLLSSEAGGVGLNLQNSQHFQKKHSRSRLLGDGELALCM